MAAGKLDAGALLTSKTRSFQMGVPSFSIGAAGAEEPLVCGSSFSLGSTDSFKVRIFLIETVQLLLVRRTKETADKVEGRRAYRFACRAASSLAPP